MSTNPTSMEAYERAKASGKVRGIQLKILWELCSAHVNGVALTAREVADRYTFDRHQIDSIRPRFAELERRGVIRKAGERVCTITKEKVVTWEPTGELPSKPKPRAESKATLLRAELEAVKKEAASLRRECADKTMEINALKAKLSKWGRPPNAIREERAMRDKAQEFPCMLVSNVRQDKHENTGSGHNGPANGACTGARQAGHHDPCPSASEPKGQEATGGNGSVCNAESGATGL